jgi:hypothetical protein
LHSRAERDLPGRDIGERSGLTEANALGIASAQFALERSSHFFIKRDRAKITGHEAHLAAYALVAINDHGSGCIILPDRSNRTDCGADRVFALRASDERKEQLILLIDPGERVSLVAYNLEARL